VIVVSTFLTTFAQNLDKSLFKSASNTSKAY
jgi:hypothetical protein